MHHSDVDSVGFEILNDHVRVALGHPAACLTVAGDRPPLEAGSVEPAEDPGPALDERLDLEVVFPDGAVAQVLGQAGREEVGGLEDVPVGGDDKLRLCHGCDLPARGRKISIPDDRQGAHAVPCFSTLDQPVGTSNADEPVVDGCGQEEKGW